MATNASPETEDRPGDHRWRPGVALSLLSAAAFLFHLLTVRGYGYFRDEIHYLACGRHLDLGYIDHPPLIGVVAG